MSENIIQTLVDCSIDSIILLCKQSKPFFKWLLDGWIDLDRPSWDILFTETKLYNSNKHNKPILKKINHSANNDVYIFTIPTGLSILDFTKRKDQIAQFLHTDLNRMKIENINNLAVITVCKQGSVQYNYEDYKFNYSTKELKVPLGINLNDYSVVYWKPCESTNAHAGIYGATGSGKSICLNTILYYLCKRKDVDLYLNDTKCSDLFLFENHVESYSEGTDYIEETASLLVDIMNQRYALLKENKCRNINKLKKNIRPNYVFLVIEEFGSFNIKEFPDLFNSLNLILSKGRAAGVFVVLVSQTVYSTLLPGNLKSNISTSICFRQKTQEASKVTTGDYMKALNLRGNGHGLLMTDQEIEFQGFIISDDMIKSL